MLILIVLEILLKMQEIKDKKINIQTEECIIFFEGDTLVKCKAFGTKDFIFTGQIFPVFKWSAILLTFENRTNWSGF